MMKKIQTLCLALCVSMAIAQDPTTGTTQGAGSGTVAKPVDAKELARLAKEAEQKRQALLKAEREGLEVRLKDISRFRGIRSNQLLGVGLIVGLSGTGDTKNTPYSQTLLANAMKQFDMTADAAILKVKNVAVVFVTCELPPYAAPGSVIEVSVQSMGDAKSLQGGQLIQTPLFAASNKETAYVVAQGPVSIGGFQVQSGGNLAQKNHPTVGRSPGIVEASVPTKIVFDGRMFLELDEADITTAKRVAATIAEKLPDMLPFAVDAGTIQLVLPDGKSPIEAMAAIEQVRVYTDNVATITINERTGTITFTSNVKIGPTVVAKGGLTVQIQQTPLVSQPSPFSNGTTATATRTDIGVNEEPAQVSLMGPNATISDLATIFQLLKVAPSDIIAILEDLKASGSLRAKIKRI